MGSGDGDWERIVAFWRVLEMIEPRAIPRATRAREKREPGTDFVEAVELRLGQSVPPLPWQEGHRRFGERPTQGRYGSAWRHTVYGGVFKFQAVREELARELRFELGEDHAGVHEEESALFAFVVDANGRLIDGTGAFSSCAWGAGRFGRLRKGDPAAFDGFETAAAKCEQALFRLLSSHVSYPTRLAARLRAATAAAARPGGKIDPKRYWGALLVDIVGGAAGGAVTTAIGGLGGVLGGPVGAAAAAGAANTVVTKVTERAERAVTGEEPEDQGQRTGSGDSRAVQALDIVVLVNAIAGHLGLPPALLNVLELRVESKPVFHRKDGSLPDPETAFLSSMIAPDLKRVADARDRGYGPALSSYLSRPLPDARRVDLREQRNRHLLTEGTSPNDFPSGRWPADLDRALVISQQFAVNTIIRDKGTAMFAVNGPPGTGKTTLLRDLIAAVVVSRATELATLKSPKDAFVNRAVVERPDGTTARLRGPRDSLTGFEIVVASSNNALAALDLHRACIEANAREVRDTLVELCRLLTRDPGRTTVKEAERAAWQTLFFLVPVLSTTFASTGRMFGPLGKEELGWLLIDEAGQALPQAAVGALWRAKRAVVVGDPRQLEPISQLPSQVQRELANSFGIVPDFIPAGRSAQALADRRSRLGTSVQTDADPVWVGMPLRVHRRCETPMFEMSNELAYGGLMVHGTSPKRIPEAGEECPPSSWFNVQPRSVSGRWVDEQGAVLARTLQGLVARHGVPLEQIYVLSPFRAVVRECRAVARNTLRAAFGDAPEGMDEFLRQHIGTVHKMQGKEADVVILVLGTDQTPGRRARDWVGAPPNLLNVAVSRARRRLYVIGSYPEWQPAPNFGVFATSDTFPKYDYFA